MAHRRSATEDRPIAKFCILTIFCSIRLTSIIPGLLLFIFIVTEDFSFFLFEHNHDYSAICIVTEKGLSLFL